MTGKRLICAALSAALACGSIPARAQWVVADPGSYSYMVEQISQQVKTVETLAEQVKTMGNVLTETEKVKNSLVGTYQKAVGLVGRIQKLPDRFVASEHSIEKRVGDLGQLKKSGGRNVGNGAFGEYSPIAIESKTPDERYTDTKKALDKVFSDPRDVASAGDRLGAMAMRYDLQQSALKEVIADSERTLASAKDRLKTVEQLAAMVDTTQNQKDAQDLTNRLLVEVLLTLNDLLATTAKAQQAESLSKYRGVTDAGRASREKIMQTQSAAKTIAQALQTNSRF